MPDEIKDRLQKSAETCVKSYEAWRNDEKNIPAREALLESIHELRKVASRLEIELALSERNQTQKPIPVPPHRNSKARPKDNGDEPKKPSKRSSGGKKAEGESDKPLKADKQAPDGEE